MGHHQSSTADPAPRRRHGGVRRSRYHPAGVFLTRRYAAADRPDAAVGWAWQQIVAARGAGRIERLADELGWSRKRLWSQFRTRIGLTPKRAARLVRFDHAVHRLVAGQPAAEVAAEISYADQSHLHHEITDFTGLTPGSVVGEPFLAVDDRAWGWPSRIAPRSAHGWAGSDIVELTPGETLALQVADLKAGRCAGRTRVVGRPCGPFTCGRREPGGPGC